MTGRFEEALRIVKPGSAFHIINASRRPTRSVPERVVFEHDRGRFQRAFAEMSRLLGERAIASYRSVEPFEGVHTKVTESAPPAVGRARVSWFDVAFLAAAPVAAWAALGINLINQNNFLDPWVYTGYGQNFESLVRIYGWPYYALRFPVVFLNTVCCSGSTPLLGYALLRYALVLLAGVPLYLLAQRHFGRPVAICAYLFLVSNALFLRVLLWDLTPFVSVPAAVAGVAIWLLADRRRWLGRFVAGALFAASVASHIYTATAIACFLAVEVVFGLADAERRRKLVPDLVAGALGAAAMFGLGILYYRSRISGFEPSQLVSQNLFALRAGSGYAVSHALPYGIWAATSTFAYVPPILATAIAALWRWRSAPTLDRRIACFFVAYCGFYLYQIIFVSSFVVETFYYFGHLTVAIVFAVPLLVALLARAAGSSMPVAAAFSIGLLVPVVALRVVFDRVNPLLQRAYGDYPGIQTFLMLCAALIALLATRRLPRPAMWMATVLLALSIQYVSLVEAAHRSVFIHSKTALEDAVYEMAVQYSRLVAKYDARETRVLAWYARAETSLFSVTFTRLGEAVNDPFNGPGMPTVGEREIFRLREPSFRYIVLLSTDPQTIASGKAAFDRLGIRFRSVESRRLGNADFSATAELVEILRPVLHE